MIVLMVSLMLELHIEISYFKSIVFPNEVIEQVRYVYLSIRPIGISGLTFFSVSHFCCKMLPVHRLATNPTINFPNAYSTEFLGLAA